MSLTIKIGFTFSNRLVTAHRNKLAVIDQPSLTNKNSKS
jgi:hypothetical protein